MRKWIFVLMAMAIAAAACDGGGDDDDDGGSAGFLVDASLGGGVNGEQALVRFKGNGASACVEDTVPGGNAVVLTGGGLTIGRNYNVIELFVNRDGDNTWDPAQDRAWTHVAVVATGDVMLTLDAGDPAAGGWTLATSLTWVQGTACPGD